MMLNRLTDWLLFFIKKYIVFLICFILMFFNFSTNLYSTVPDMNTFKSFDRISTDLIIVNLIHDKFYAKDNILLQCSPKQGDYDFWSDYINNKPINEAEFSNYYSQIGLHGQFYVFLDNTLKLSPKYTLKLFYILNAALLSFCLAFFINWIRKNLGIFTATLILILVTFLSPDLTAFGRHLYWAGWTLFIPLVSSIFVIQSKFFQHKYGSLFSTLIVFLGCLIKFLCYFEFTSTILVAAMIPFVFYALTKEKSLINVFKICIFPAIGSLFAFLVASFYKIIVIANIEHSLSKSIQIFKDPISYRLTGEMNNSNPLVSASASASVIDVVNTYFHRTAFTIFNLSINYSELFFIFLFFGFLGFIILKNIEIDIITKNNIFALIVATFMSLLAPLSWFILAKPHSYIHTEQCSILWDIPFVLFGFALVGYIISVFIKSILSRLYLLKN